MNVSSSSIKTIEYKEGTLIVLFTSNRTYEYYKVPAEVWEAFKQAESKGRFLNQNIKGKYEFKEV